MAPIDLIPYAEHSRKLSQRLLVPVHRKGPVDVWKILTVHFFDFSMTYMLSSFMALMFNLSIKTLMVTNGLKSAFNEGTAFKLSLAFMPVILFSYFFSSYFLNHGQTWGMTLLKRRVEMQENSLKDAFIWATHSFLLCATGGLSYLVKKDIWQSFKTHDHLYAEMFKHNDFVFMDLVKEADGNNHQHVEEEWKKAA